jgi:uncharacterized short protein YbdD (DUF466 family)
MTAPVSSTIKLRRLLSGAAWYLREVSGETAYDRYVEHVRSQHPNAAVMSRRDFERWRQDRCEQDPRARCC